MRSPRSVTDDADRHALAQLEGRDRLAGAAHVGCWPAIVASCSAAASSSLVSCLASPTPMFSVIFSSFGRLHRREL